MGDYSGFDTDSWSVFTFPGSKILFSCISLFHCAIDSIRVYKLEICKLRKRLGAFNRNSTILDSLWIFAI